VHHACAPAASCGAAVAPRRTQAGAGRRQEPAQSAVGANCAAVAQQARRLGASEHPARPPGPGNCLPADRDGRSRSLPNLSAPADARQRPRYLPEACITPIIYLARAAGLPRRRGADYLFGAPEEPRNSVVCAAVLTGSRGRPWGLDDFCSGYPGPLDWRGHTRTLKRRLAGVRCGRTQSARPALTPA
jgi:hypothetical protein